MRFFYAKKTLQCKGCGSKLFRGEVCVRTYSKNKITGQGYGRVYHYECYINFFVERMREQAVLWLGTQEHRKPLGRPKLYKDGKEINRVKSLIKYHKVKGNVERVKELEQELAKLSNKYNS